MVLSQREIRARKEKILGITVQQYVETVTPVSSSFIAERYPLELSSATVRNILKELEEEGLLTHPHTSAGRIPTERGYRYYVDNMMREIELLEDEKEKIKAEYRRQHRELESLLDKTSEVLSNTTNYTSIISVDGQKNKIFCRGTNYVVNYPDYNDINKIKEILTALDEKERLLQIINRDLRERIDIYIGHEIACREMESCSLILSEYSTNEGYSGRIAILGPTRMNYEKVVSTLEYFSKLLTEMS